MHKKVLSEIDLHYGNIDMPKGFEIDLSKLQKDILSSHITDSDFPHSREWDKLNTYIREEVYLEHNFSLVLKKMWGNVYKPQEISVPLLHIDAVDLRNSADYTFLYGVNVKDCSVRIHYDDNRRAGRSWDIPLKNNKFLMFPSTQMYYITNKQKESLNFIFSSTYESV